MDVVRSDDARAVVDHDVLVQCVAAQLQPRLGRLVLPVQVAILHAVYAANDAGTASRFEVSLDLGEFGCVMRLVGRVEQDQSRIAVRRIDRLPVRRQTGGRGVPAADRGQRAQTTVTQASKFGQQSRLDEHRPRGRMRPPTERRALGH